MRTKSTAIIRALLCLLLVFSFALNASADVIWEPYGDSFYESHRKEITHTGRHYTSSSDTDVYKAPDKSRTVKTVPAGEEINIQSVWTDSSGKQWGCAAFKNNDSGWVDMTELKPVYDYISFKEEHKDEITASLKVIKMNDSVSFYAYPGASQPLDINPSDFGETAELSASDEYTSPDGSTWYFCSYFYGHRNIWFTTSPQSTEKPSGTEITTVDAQVSASVSSLNTDESANAVGAAAFPAEQSTEASSDTETVRTAALVLVAVLAVGMAVLIPVIMKKKKN